MHSVLNVPKPTCEMNGFLSFLRMTRTSGISYHTLKTLHPMERSHVSSGDLPKVTGSSPSISSRGLRCLPSGAGAAAWLEVVWGCGSHFLTLPICCVVLFLSNTHRLRRSPRGSCPRVPDCSTEQLRSHITLSLGSSHTCQRQVLASHFSGPNAPRYFASSLIHTGHRELVAEP